jgi:hypothetical protein
MRPDFQCDPTAGQGAEDLLQRFRIRPDSLFPLYLAGFVHHAVPTVAISQIQSNGQFLRRNIPALRCRSGANLLHCRSPFICASSTSITWGAYRIHSDGLKRYLVKRLQQLGHKVTLEPMEAA